MKFLKQKGFTLIELLVVIAIIGLLATIVMVALNSARSQGSSAGIRAQMTSLRNQAELYYNTTGNKTFGTITASPSGAACPGNSNLFRPGTNSLSSILNGIIADGIPVSHTWCMTNGTTVLGATAWAVAVLDPSVPSGTQAFCVDSTGVALRTTTVPANTPMSAVNISTIACN